MKERCSDKETEEEEGHRKLRAKGRVSPCIYLSSTSSSTSQPKQIISQNIIRRQQFHNQLYPASFETVSPQIQKAMSKPVTSTPRSTYFIIQAFSAFRTSASRDDANLDRSCTSDPIAAWQT